VSAWLSKKVFSKRVKEDNVRQAARDNVKRMGLINKARAAERKARYSQALHSADTEYKHYKKDALFIAGLMIYAGHGDVSNPSQIRLTTQRVDSHRIFIKFLGEYVGVEHAQVSFWLLLYSDMKEVAEMKWWSRNIKLSVAHFGKTQFVAQATTKKTLHHGTGNTIIGDTVAKIKLIRWIELANKDL